MLISGGSAPVGVIGKVLRILELLDQFPDGLQLKDVAAKTGINGGFLNLRGETSENLSKRLYPDNPVDDRSHGLHAVGAIPSIGGSMKFIRTNFSRRTLVQNAGIVAGAGLLGLGTGATVHPQSASPARGNGKPRALALIGDRYHNPDYIRVSLEKVFKDLDIPIDYTIQYDQISPSLLKNYQLLLILRDGMIWPDGYLGPDAYTAYEADLETPKTFPDPKPVMWIKDEQGAAIKEFVTAGGGFYALHNCSHISLSSKDYREVMGGAYIGHPPLRPFQVHATANKHPITDGMSSFMVNDEQHYVTYDKDPKYVILEAENVDGLKFQDLGTKSISGWAYDFGQGRVVFTAVGHTIHAMWNPQYIEIQKRSVRWLLKEL